MVFKWRHKLDPLDQALLERALESARAIVKKDFARVAELESDDELEASLKRELVEIALSNGVREIEALNILVNGFLDTPKKPG